MKCRACRTPMDPLDRDACARCGAPYHVGCLVPCDGCGARVGGCCGWGVCTACVLMSSAALAADQPVGEVPKPFRPISPAEMLREMLEHPSLSHLLENTLPVSVRGVLNGSRSVGPMEARCLSALLVTSEHYWLRLQELYDEDVARCG